MRPDEKLIPCNRLNAKNQKDIIINQLIFYFYEKKFFTSYSVLVCDSKHERTGSAKKYAESKYAKFARK